MTKRIAIDASVFIAKFIPEEPHHEISQKFIEAVIQSGVQIMIPVWTLFEVLHAYYRRSDGALEKTDGIYKNFIEWNLTRQIRFVNMEADFLVYFTAHHHRFSLKTADSVVALNAHRLKCPLITWDKKLINSIKGRVEAMTPEKFLQKN